MNVRLSFTALDWQVQLADRDSVVAALQQQLSARATPEEVRNDCPAMCACQKHASRVPAAEQLQLALYPHSMKSGLSKQPC